MSSAFDTTLAAADVNLLWTAGGLSCLQTRQHISPWTAIIGTTLYHTTDEQGGVLVEWESEDWVGLVSGLTVGLDGAVTVPQVGDVILRTVNGTTLTYEVLPPPGNMPYRWSGPTRTMIRAHTKLVEA